MSAFNDYCIVCEQLCSSTYCSDSCKEKDTQSKFTFNNVPQLISPVLQPARQNSITELIDKEYLIKSPLLLSSNVKSEIAGLSLDNSNPVKTASKDEPVGSSYYKKWLGVTH